MNARRTLLLACLAACVPARAEDCAALAARAKGELLTHYRASEMRALTARVAAALTPQESAELSEMSALFNATPHAGDGVDRRIALQKRARRITRAAARRAGLRVINAEEPSPYDAELPERLSPDGFTAYGVELRSLLISEDPRPHATLWVRRSDPLRNPRLIVSVGFRADAGGDYVSWMGPGGRLSASVDRFVANGLPASCR